MKGSAETEGVLAGFIKRNKSRLCSHNIHKPNVL